LHKTRPEVPPANRPGVPPVIVTWADPQYLGRFREEVVALRRQVDVVIASHHWGLYQEVLDYMREIAHAAIDAGADVVVGHGPHFVLPVEVYQGKPIFYGMGNFSFHTGHGGRQHGDWVGLLARVLLEERTIKRVALRFVRHNDRNETLLRAPGEEPEALRDLTERSAPFGTRISVEGDEAVVAL
jgi:poly-gamma-glutamate synthesis protein (capsule biosynthesis protein)